MLFVRTPVVSRSLFLVQAMRPETYAGRRWGPAAAKSVAAKKTRAAAGKFRPAAKRKIIRRGKMKKQLTRAFAVFGLMLMSAAFTGASAQTVRTIFIHVPFEFVVGDK